jgi:hypothetical protein
LIGADNLDRKFGKEAGKRRSRQHGSVRTNGMNVSSSEFLSFTKRRMHAAEDVYTR